MKPYGENNRKIRWWIKDSDDRNLCSGAANIDKNGNLFPVSYTDAELISLETFTTLNNTLKEEDKKELILRFATFGSNGNEEKRKNANSYYAPLYKTLEEILFSAHDFQIAPAGYRPSWNLNSIPL